MRNLILRLSVLLTLAAVAAPAQDRNAPLTEEAKAKRQATEKELESIAVIDRKVMVPMRDGKRMAADIYRPKDASKNTPSSLCARLTTSIIGMCATACLAT